jgi:molybdopterin/thiamine biosynthesis adenylyltransferase
MLSERERERYKRQMMLFGSEGQERLCKAHIFIAGAGGLGSPVSLYLAVAGIGTITIADMDTVDQTNLNRQILHTDRDIGKKKAISAKEKLAAINPDIRINAIDTRIDERNASRLVGDADAIVDAMDNYPARYLLNDVAIRKNIPLFHGAIRGFYGQAMTVIPGKTPCMRCIFPKPPPEETLPAVGATAGVIGTVQATEVLKFLLKSGDLLTGRLLIWDGLAGRADEIFAERIPCCPACSGTCAETPAGGKKK